MHCFSLHTHTSALDGYHSIFEMAEHAKRIGFSALGISEHFIVYPNIFESAMYQAASHPRNPAIKPYHQIYSDSFEQAIAKILPVYKQIDVFHKNDVFPVYKGLEVDFFDYSGWDKGFKKAVEVLKPDYVVGACHFSVCDENLLNMHDILKKPVSEQDKIVKDYWERLQRAVKSGFFDWMAHPDLYKRHGIGCADKFLPNEEQTFALMSKYRVATEINTSSLNKKAYKIADFMRLLGLIAKFNVPAIINDDAHHISQLGQNYETAIELSQKAGIENFYRPILKNTGFALQKIHHENQR